jgi:PRC-barrel domain
VDEPVQNSAGEKVGEIDAIVTDKTAGAHGYAVIGFGGVLGVGEKQVLVHLDQLLVADDGTIQLTASDKKDFDAYPEYVEKNFKTYDGAIAQLL